MMTTLTSLERTLAAAKADRDNDRVRALVPEVNNARREFREFAEAYAEQCERRGTDIDGNPRMPDQKLMGAIFGADKPSKDALARLQVRWESGDVALEAIEPEEMEPDEPMSYRHLAEALDENGRYQVEANMEFFRFSDLEAAQAFMQALPVYAELRDLERTAGNDWADGWAASWAGYSD